MSNNRGTIQEVAGVIKRVPSGQMGSAGIAERLPLQTQQGPSVKTPSQVSAEATDLYLEHLAKPLPDPTQMSWRPLTSPRRVTFLGTSFPAVSRALTEAFGEFPLRLRPEHRATLKAMAAVADEGREPYDQIADALQKHGDVEVGVE